MLITDAVHIWRDPEGDYHIEWEASHPDTRVQVESLAATGSVEQHSTAESRRARVSGLPGASRHYFRLSDQHGNSVLATERKLGMRGAPNFRDFGGYRTADGRRVKWGYLFRSGQLSRLSDQDLELLDSLRLDLVCDLRRTEEQANDPSRLPPLRTPRVASLPITPGSNSDTLENAHAQWGGSEAMHSFMVGINRDFVERQGHRYAEMFREILAAEDARFLVHCAAGKDRTGFAAAIILLALGVPEATVMGDYLLTSRFFHPQRELARVRAKYGMEDLDAEVILPMLEARREYLAEALAAIEAEFGTLETYLDKALGVGPQELQELRRRYLEE